MEVVKLIAEALHFLGKIGAVTAAYTDQGINHRICDLRFYDLRF